MSTTGSGQVLVGVTGEGETPAALQFALDAAQRQGWRLTVVHALHQVMPPPPPGVLLTYETMEEVGHQITAEVVEVLQERYGEDLSVAQVVRTGHPVNVLVDLSNESDLIVLQHRALSKLHRVFTGSTVIGVAAHAHCPVVSVPAGWSAPREAGRVSVGVHEDGHPSQVLEVAFAEAAARRSRLHIFHAWRLSPAYDDLALPHGDDAWSQHTQRVLTQQIAPLQDRYPGVEVDLEVRYQWPIEALVEVGASSDLLVLGRHSAFAPLLQRIGSLARAAVAHVACPLMVVPVERHRDVAADTPRPH